MGFYANGREWGDKTVSVDGKEFQGEGEQIQLLWDSMLMAESGGIKQ